MKINNNNIQYNTNFTGYRTLLGRRLDKVISNGLVTEEDNLFIVREITKLYQKRISDYKNLGEGMQNRVYKIDDKYVFKIPIDRPVKLGDKLVIEKQKYGNLKTYYGETIAKLGNLRILKNVSPKGKAIPAGVPKDLPKEYAKDDIVKYYGEVYLPSFANIPQRSYDMLAQDIKTLGNLVEKKYIHYTFDYFNPNNVVLAGKSLRMTDDVEMTVWNNKNTISDLLNVFLRQMNVGIPATPSEKFLLLRQQIAKKIIKAGMKYNLPITGEDKPNCVFDYVLKFLCKSKDTTKSIFDNLLNIQKMGLSSKERSIIVDEYLNKIFSINNLSEKV